MVRPIKPGPLQRRWNIFVHRLLPRHHDSRKVALSVFLGVFIGVWPTIGVAIFLTIGAAALFRVPKLPGVMASFIAIPPTLFLFFYPAGYSIGKWILQPPPVAFDFLAEFDSMTFRNFIDVIQHLSVRARPHLVAFLLGITIVAFLTGLVCYIATLKAMQWRHAQFAKKRARMAQRSTRHFHTVGAEPHG